MQWGIDLQSEHERYLTEKHAKKPVIVMNYPKDIKAFYMRVNDDGRTVAAMDVLAPGIGEIIGGSQREERLDVLDARMAERGIDQEHYGWYRDLRRYGTVPHAGFGLGFERTHRLRHRPRQRARRDSVSRARPGTRGIEACGFRYPSDAHRCVVDINPAARNLVAAPLEECGGGNRNGGAVLAGVRYARFEHRGGSDLPDIAEFMSHPPNR